jgi:hypothetical protein
MELVDGYQPMEPMLLNARNSEPALMLFLLIRLLARVMDRNVLLTERNVLTKEHAQATPLKLLATLVELTEPAYFHQMLADRENALMPLPAMLPQSQPTVDATPSQLKTNAQPTALHAFLSQLAAATPLKLDVSSELTESVLGLSQLETLPQQQRPADLRFVKTLN